MKSFKLTIPDSGFPAETVFTGLCDFNHGQSKGYCIMNPDGTPTDKCFFKSYVEGNPIFEEVTETKAP